MTESEARRKLFSASRTGNLKLMKKVFQQYDNVQDLIKNFKRRDPEGRFIINNILLRGHADMLEFLLENWASEHAGLQLTLDGHLSIFHQAMA
jgi:hypothetical protein